MARFEFTIAQKRQMAKRSKGVCEAGNEGTWNFYGLEQVARCANKATEFDHVVTDALVQTKPKDAGDGLHVCKACHRFKTSHHDIPKVAKAKRIEAKSHGISAPKAKIQSAPFWSNLKPDKTARQKAKNDDHIAKMAAKDSRLKVKHGLKLGAQA